MPTSPTHAAAALTNNSQTTVFFVVVYAAVAKLSWPQIEIQILNFIKVVIFICLCLLKGIFQPFELGGESQSHLRNP